MFDPLIRKIQIWHRRRATLHLLHQLDDRLLADMGAHRETLEAFIASRSR